MNGKQRNTYLPFIVHRSSLIVSGGSATMADWQKLAKELLLADGTIDRREVDLMRKELFADGGIDDIELEFLLELKKSAASVAPTFRQLVLDAIKNNVLADGVITAQEASWLRRWIISEGAV